MAGNYGPEIKASMDAPVKRPSQVKKGAETPADRLRDARRGIKEGSPQDLKLDAEPANQAPPAQTTPAGPVQPHVAAAAGIAHAILANRGM